MDIYCCFCIVLVVRKMFPNGEFFLETADTQTEGNDDDQTASEELVDNGTTSNDLKS